MLKEWGYKQKQKNNRKSSLRAKSNTKVNDQNLSSLEGRPQLHATSREQAVAMNTRTF